jgi:two-component system, NarL family, nitrate/nitrite response regulator NarL
MTDDDLTTPALRRMPPSLLIVDDQILVREGLSRLLRSAPLPLGNVHAVANTADALAYARATPPDLVLLDVDLGGEDGLALLPLLGRHAHVMVLTCLTDTATRTRAFGLGASAFVGKHEPAALMLIEVRALADRYLRGEVPPRRVGGESGAVAGASSDVRSGPAF